LFLSVDQLNTHLQTDITAIFPIPNFWFKYIKHTQNNPGHSSTYFVQSFDAVSMQNHPTAGAKQWQKWSIFHLQLVIHPLEICAI
jgi:Ulp1 family protease